MRDAPQTHAEAILSALDLLQLLYDSGVLNLLRGMAATVLDNYLRGTPVRGPGGASAAGSWT